MKAPKTALFALTLLSSSAPIALAEQPAPKSTNAQSEDALSLKALPAQDVQAVQQALRDRGKYKGAVDGIPGPSTVAALEAFQRDRGLPTTGLTKETRFELGMKPAPDAQNDTTAQRAAAPQNEANLPASAESEAPVNTNATEVAKLDKTQIRQMQRRLHRLGYFSGEADGKFSPATRQALSRFYRDQADLAQNGRISLPGAMALGLNPADVQPVSGSDQPARGQSGD